MLTQAQRRHYVAGGGVRCPHCHSDRLNTGQGEFDAGIAWVTVRCATCRQAWHEVFHLATINALDKNGHPIFDDEDEPLPVIGTAADPHPGTAP
jgi:hypothetical protein